MSDMIVQHDHHDDHDNHHHHHYHRHRHDHSSSSSRLGADYDIETTAAITVTAHDRDTDGAACSEDFGPTGMLGRSFSSRRQQKQQRQQQQAQLPIASRVQIQFSLPLQQEDDDIPANPKATTTTTTTATSPLERLDDNNDVDTDTDDAASITSITSIPYFDPTDFKPANWDTISDHAPTIGFALFGFAMALTHPVFFMAGLATALGTATAASRGYDCLVDGACGFGATTTSNATTSTTTNTITNAMYNNSWFGTSTTTEQEAAAAAAAAGVVNPAPLLDKTLVDHPPVVVLPEPEQKQQEHPPEQGGQSLFAIPVEKRISSMGSSSTTTTTTDTAEEQNEHDTKQTSTAPTATQDHHHHHHHSLKRPLPSRDVSMMLLSTQQATITTTAEQEAIMSWWKQQYPPLKNTVIQDQCFVGLNVAEFFRVFFSDHAPYNFQEFQVKRGDRNITYGAWTPITLDPSLCLQQEPISMHPDAKTTTESSQYHRDSYTYHSYQTRTLNFQAKTNNGLLGPAYATTTKTQRWMMVSKRFAVLESKTVLHNIPFCDKFFVMERWYLHATKSKNTNANGSTSASYYTTQLTVTAGVYFVDTCPFEMAIRSKSATAIRDVVTAWTAMAVQALELTKQAKLDRLSKSCSESSPRRLTRDDRVGVNDDDEEEEEDDDDNNEEEENQRDKHNGKDTGYDNTDDIEVHYSASTFSSGASNGQSDLSLVRSETEPVKKKRSVLVGLRRSLSQIVASNRQKQQQQQQPVEV